METKIFIKELATECDLIPKFVATKITNYCLLQNENIDKESLLHAIIMFSSYKYFIFDVTSVSFKIQN